jgi:nucleoside-diphosphate-sugar epimerase
VSGGGAAVGAVASEREGRCYYRPMRRLLIIGCGDVLCRALPALVRRYRRVYALVRNDTAASRVRAAGAVPVRGDLDRRDTLARLAGLAGDLVHSAPPPVEGEGDPRTRRLRAALGRRGGAPGRGVYLSTTGVYGDCRGERVAETRPPRPQTARARRRVHAERLLRAWVRERGTRIAILRVPGIYAGDRLPLERLRAGTPVLAAGQDPWTSHIHAVDLARIVVRALLRGRAGRVYHACDDSELTIGQYFDRVADRHALPHPPRVDRARAEAGAIPAPMLSFMRESRRLSNARLKRELGIRLVFPTVDQALAAGAGSPA